MATGHSYWRTKWPEPSVGDRAWAIKSPDAPDTFIGYAVYRDRAKADEVASGFWIGIWHGPFSVVRVEYVEAVTKLEAVREPERYFIEVEGKTVRVTEIEYDGFRGAVTLKRLREVEPARWVEVEDETANA